MTGDRTADSRAFLALPLQAQIPAELRDLLCDFPWDLDKLQRLPLPVGTATVDSLRWHLDLAYCVTTASPFMSRPARSKPTPRYPEQYQRTMAADLGYPLDLLFRNVQWVILNGVHRLLKADLLGLSKVQVRRLPAAILPLILHEAT